MSQHAGPAASSPIVADKYQLGPILGIGTYGQVHFARPLSHLHSQSHPVAAKLIDASRLSAATRHSLNTEIKLQRRVNGDNCIKLLESYDSVEVSGHWCSQCACNHFQPHTDTGNDSHGDRECACCEHSVTEHSQRSPRSCLLLIQELALCGELFSLISHTGPFPEPLARHCFKALIAAVSECHGVDVVHRDLKPENIIFNHRGELKLCDFGLAALRPTPKPVSSAAEKQIVDDDFDYQQYYNNMKNNTDANTHNTRANNDSHVHGHGGSGSDDDGTCVHHTGCGSQTYSAPEVYYREFHHYRPYKGAPADLWSCAVILYVMLVGRPPYVRPIARSYNNNLYKRDKNFLALLKGEYPASVSEKAKRLLVRMFRIHPDDRLTLEEIQCDEWLTDNRLNVSAEEAAREIIERAKRTWCAQGKNELVELLNQIREQEAMMKRPNTNARTHAASGGGSRASAIHPSNRSAQSQSQRSEDDTAIAQNLSNLRINTSLASVTTTGTTSRASNTNNGTQSSVPSTSRVSPSGAYRTFFRSARPPSTQSLSITAQNALKPTAWPRDRSHSRSDDDDDNDSVDDDGDVDVDDDDDDDDDDDGDGEAEVDDAGYENDDSSVDTEDKRSEHSGEAKSDDKKLSH